MYVTHPLHSNPLEDQKTLSKEGCFTLDVRAAAGRYTGAAGLDANEVLA